jgi:pimeloyl-ACP methyl ester carboxylesterase
VEATLRVLDPRDRETLEWRGLPIPLAADFTAPLAYTLEVSPIWERETSGFFAGALEVPPGLFQLARRPGRIPVVFVHGTASSPARWSEMINALTSDERLRDRIQVWVFSYPTGNPVVYSAAQLRESLADVVAEMDPEGKDPALHRMVLVGHSQGGLLCRMASASRPPGDLLLPDGRAVPDLGLTPEAEALLLRCMEIRAAPEVSRVVFLATPHGGSFFAGNWISRLAASFVRVTRTFEGALADRFRDHPEKVVVPEEMEIPTAVEDMTPGSDFIRVYSSLVPGPGVIFHSIIPVAGDGEPADLHDGIVAYRSAHIEGVASEFVVRSGHSCQDRPLVIEEVRRILLEHLAAGEAPAPPPAPPTSPGSRP